MLLTITLMHSNLANQLICLNRKRRKGEKEKESKAAALCLNITTTTLMPTNLERLRACLVLFSVTIFNFYCFLCSFIKFYEIVMILV